MRYSNHPVTKEYRQLLRRSRTPSECIMWKHLNKRQLDGFRFRQQHGFGPYVLDFYCPELKLCIEIDGEIHDTPENQQKDKDRTSFLNQNGINVLRFRNEEVENHIDDVIKSIREYMERYKNNASSDPQPPNLGGLANEQEVYYTIALTRMTGFNFQTALQLYRELGGGKAVYEHRNDIKEVMPDCSDRLAKNLRDWSLPLARAAEEMEFISKHRIQPLLLGDEFYPQRLCDCPDAPIILYYLGSAPLNQRRVINLIGTRHCTIYGKDLIQHFIRDLKRLCPDVLIVSGLAYGVDINAHRQALENGYDTVGVLAHGLDDLYPSVHRDTAKQMVNRGGLLTEYVSQTRSDKINFVKRNRIVAGMSDATILVESAAKGGGLITARIAMDYNRSVFAFPGPIGAPYSEGCNNLIRDNGAQLITNADDFVAFMGWQSDLQLKQAHDKGIERDLFPSLSPEEQTIVDVLGAIGDLQMDHLSLKSHMPVGQLTALLFQLEMKGVVRPMAGGTYHLLK